MRNSALKDLQSLRGIAAAMVMCYHTGTIYALTTGHLLFGNLFRGGFLGVDVFFVLSGFVMYWAHARDFGDRSAVGVFVKKRLVRIMPIYWLVLLVKLLRDWDVVDSLTLVCAALLIPYPRVPYITVSWTLSYEMFFYAAVACMIVLPRGWMTSVPMLVLATLAVWPSPIEAPHGIAETLMAFPFNPHLSEFILGLGAAWLVANRPLGKRGSMALLGVSLVLVAVLLGLATWLSTDAASRDAVTPAYELAELSGNVLFTHAVWVFGLPFAALLMGFVMCEHATGRPRLPFLTWLGDISYSLYLVHGFVIFGALKMASVHAFVSVHEWAMLLVMGAAVAAGAATHHALEKPLMKALKPWVSRT